MSSAELYDFAVVGVGPAGARFARQAADRGHRVIAFEQGAVGTPLACSGHVSTDIYRYLPPGAARGLRQNEISAARFHVGGPDAPGHRFYREETISVVIDRVGLDRALAAAATTAGADVRTHHTVTAVTPGPAHVDVEVQTPDGPLGVRARMVVGADGPTSRTRRALGIDPPRELLHGVLGFDPTPDAADHVDVHLIVPGFFAWRIPRGEAGVEYGIAGAPGADLRARFRRFLSAYDVSLSDRCSGAIPIGPPASTVGDRGFVVGDAAAQTKPFTGGGILYGMQAADIAAAAIDPTDPATLQRYERRWRRALAREVRLGAWVRRAYDLPAPLQRLGLRALSGEIDVHMDRPTSLFSGRQIRRLLRL
jgi:geranylgeranyl reductase family